MKIVSLLKKTFNFLLAKEEKFLVTFKTIGHRDSRPKFSRNQLRFFTLALNLIKETLKVGSFLPKRNRCARTAVQTKQTLRISN